MKKILAYILTLCLMVSVLVIPGISVAAAESSDGIYQLLGELNIMNGDPDGNLRLDDAVTRAEFTKISVAASSYKDSVATYLSISPFQDVTYQHWAAPYVRVGVTNSLVTGYPDATFRPDETVLYEEAITILLRVLGYTDEDFGSSWPYGQLGMASNLDMTKDVNCSAGQAMNRRQVAQLVYNTLSVKLKGQNAQLSSVFDVTIYEDVTLISDSSDDSSIASDELYTSQGTYKIDNDLFRSQLGLKGEIAIKNSSKMIAFVPNEDSANSEQYIFYSLLPNAAMVYKNGSLTQITINDSTPVYKGKTQSTFGSVKSSLELGDILRVKTSSSGIDYITCQSGNLEGPKTISATGVNLNWDTNAETKVLRNGQNSSMDTLEPYDVAYFLPDLNLVLAYSDKVTGVYETASPNKDMPQSVTVSGKTYDIEGSSAFTKLASGGNFDYGDTVTVLLGKDGGIADVISANENSSDKVVGYVLESGTKDYQSGVTDTYTGYYINVVFPDGTTGEYATSTDKSSFKNKAVTITFKNGYANLTLLDSDNNTLSGTYKHSTGKLGSYTVASDAQILDIGTTDSGDSSVYCRIYPQRLDGVKISSSQVLYYQKNTAGEIDKMILKDVTGDGFSYGLMMTATQDTKTFSGTYKYMIEGKIYQLSVNKLLNIGSGSGIKISGNVSNPDIMTALVEIRGDIDLVNASKLTYKNSAYPISANVAVYKKSSDINSEYVKIPITNILDTEDLNFSAYYDKATSSGGQIRVIVVY